MIWENVYFMPGITFIYIDIQYIRKLYKYNPPIFIVLCLSFRRKFFAHNNDKANELFLILTGNKIFVVNFMNTFAENIDC